MSAVPEQMPEPVLPLGLIAGAGTLPADIVAACNEQGRPVFVVALEGFADHPLLFQTPHAVLQMAKAGAILENLREAGCKDVVMAGRVSRPSAASLVPDKQGAAIIGRLVPKLRQGDDALLTAVGDEFERAGFRLVAIQDILSNLLSPEGVAGAIAPDDAAMADIRAGNSLAKAIGSLEIGQGVVVQQGLTLAVEAIEGTDAMLSRVGPLKRSGSRPVLVKARKPQQSDKVDLPTIGPATVRAAANAGLAGIAYEAGQTLMAEQGETIRQANEVGLFLFGYTADMINAGDSPRKVMIVAGEASGDLLGKRVMAAMREQAGNNVSFIGVGGPQMESEGLTSLFPMKELSVMGITEILPKLRGLMQRLKETVALADREKPDLVLTIDSPGFTYRLAKRLAHLNIPRVHLVAPTVWAWKEKRAKHCADVFDHMLTLLPFEPPFFEKEGLASSFVGHPIIESPFAKGDGTGFRERHNISSDEKVILVLPGSRAGEVSRLADIFGETLEQVKKQAGPFRVITPTVPQMADTIKEATGSWPVDIQLVIGDDEKFDAFAAADVALAASGTVSLELAAAGLPQVIGYRLSVVTTFLVRRMVKIHWASLVNILLDRDVVPEYLFEDCEPANLSAELVRLLQHEDLREQQVSAYQQALDMLKPDGQLPSQAAAGKVLEILDKTRPPCRDLNHQ